MQRRFWNCMRAHHTCGSEYLLYMMHGAWGERSLASGQRNLHPSLEEKPQKLCLLEGNRLRGLDKEDATSCAFVIFVQSTSESNWGKLPRQAGKRCGLLNIDFG